jgi:anthranilate synthase
LPEELVVTARSDDGVVMAVEHSSLPLAAVQFHPESILSLEGDGGLRLIRNVVARLRDADQTSCANAPSSPRTNVG